MGLVEDAIAQREEDLEITKSQMEDIEEQYVQFSSIPIKHHYWELRNKSEVLTQEVKTIKESNYVPPEATPLEQPKAPDPIKDTEKAIKEVAKGMEELLKVYNGRFAQIPLTSPYWGMLNHLSKLSSQLAFLTR